MSSSLLPPYEGIGLEANSRLSTVIRLERLISSSHVTLIELAHCFSPAEGTTILISPAKGANGSTIGRGIGKRGKQY
jgi:NADPH-dependent curcumin reductase CurA